MQHFTQYQWEACVQAPYIQRGAYIDKYSDVYSLARGAVKSLLNTNKLKIVFSSPTLLRDSLRSC